MCASQIDVRRRPRAPSNTRLLFYALISTECQEQQRLTGSVHLGAVWYVCGVITRAFLCVCVHVCLPHQKQRDPNTHSCMSINITGCQSTSNNAAVIYDNTNTSSYGEPEKPATTKRQPSLTVKGIARWKEIWWKSGKAAGWIPSRPLPRVLRTEGDRWPTGLLGRVNTARLQIPEVCALLRL